MARKLFDHAVGSDAHVSVEVGDDGQLGVEVSYSVEKLREPLIAFLQKITAKVSFLNRQVPNIVNGLFTSFGVAALQAEQPVVPSAAGPAAHENAPVEPAAPSV